MNHSNLQILKVGSISNTLFTAFQNPVLLVKCFQSSCSKLINVCFNNESFKDRRILNDALIYDLNDALKMLPYFFFCAKNLPDIIMISCPMHARY